MELASFQKYLRSAQDDRVSRKRCWITNDVESSRATSFDGFAQNYVFLACVDVCVMRHARNSGRQQSNTSSDIVGPCYTREPW